MLKDINIGCAGYHYPFLCNIKGEYQCLHNLQFLSNSILWTTFGNDVLSCIDVWHQLIIVIEWKVKEVLSANCSEKMFYKLSSVIVKKYANLECFIFFDNISLFFSFDSLFILLYFVSIFGYYTILSYIL